MTPSHEKTAEARFSASHIYAQEFWRERDRMAFAGLLAYGLVYVVAIIVLGHQGARVGAIACAGVTYVSYALQAARAPSLYSNIAVAASVLMGALAGFAFLGGF